jgi:solute carrier family 50 protein (sugar transporter)
MLSAKTIILEYVCPAMGMIIGNIMFATPYRALKQAVDRGHLGDLNPTPWAFMLGNCFGWITYSILLRNFWLFFANGPGFLLSIWLNLGAVKLLYQGHHATEMRKSLVVYLQQQENEQEQSKRELDASVMEHATEPTPTASPKKTMTNWATLVWNVTSQTTPAPAPHETMVMGIVLVWTIVVLLISFAQSFDARTKELIVGILVNLNLVFFYGAPLSTIYTVLSNKKSDSIHIPTMIINTLNGSFWTAYGLAVMDPFIYAPNGLGALLGVVQMILCALFPRSKGGRATTTSTNNNEETEPARTHKTASTLELIGGEPQPAMSDSESGARDP